MRALALAASLPFLHVLAAPLSLQCALAQQHASDSALPSRFDCTLDVPWNEVFLGAPLGCGPASARGPVVALGGAFALLALSLAPGAPKDMEGAQASEARSRTLRVDQLALHALSGADGSADLLVVSRWGWVEDYGAPPRNTRFEVFDGGSGETRLRSDWTPDGDARFDVRTSALVQAGEGRSELLAFEHDAGWAELDRYALCAAGPDGSGRRAVFSTAPAVGEELGPKLLAPIGDWDGDGRGDVAALAIAWITGEIEPGESAYLDDLIAIHSGADGHELARFAQPPDRRPLFRGFSIAPGPVDVSGDGAPDVVVAARVASEGIQGGGALFVYTGAEPAPARTLGPYPMLGEFGRIDASADVDEDGAQDVVFGTRPAPLGDAVSILHAVSGRTGEALFDASLRDNGKVDAFFVRDRNGDGVSDVFVLLSADLRRSFHASLCSGADGAELAHREVTQVGGLGVPNAIVPVKLGDVDGDGLEDVALAIQRWGANEPSSEAVAVLSGASLATAWQRVLAGPVPEVREPTAHERWRDAVAHDGPLTPPSLALIQSFPELPVPELEDPAAVTKLVEMTKSSATTLRALAPNDPERGSRQLFLAEPVMRRIASLCHEPPWTEAEAQRIVSLTTLLSAMGVEPELAATSHEPDELRRALACVKAWWETGSLDDDFIADLVLFLDDGPFHGVLVEATELDGLRHIGSTALEPEGGAVELVAGDDPARLYLRRVRADGSAHWCRRLTTTENDEAREPAGLHAERVALQAGFGWVVKGHVKRGAKSEGATFYLDPTGRLRFYSVSW